MTTPTTPGAESRVAMLVRAADLVPVRPLDVAALRERSRRAEARRRSLVAAGAAAAVVAVAVPLAASIGGPPAGPGVGGSPSTPPSRTASSDPSGGGPGDPVVPDGTRLAGAGRVVVAVPSDWGTGLVGCDGVTPVAPTVVRIGDASRACRVEPAEPVPSLAVVDPGSTLADQARADAVVPRDVHGVAMLVSHPAIGKDGLVRMWLVAPDPAGEVVLRVATPELADTEGIVDSVQLLPADWLTLPWTVPEMADAGLRVQERGVQDDEREEGALLGSDPGSGSAVRAGSDVTVEVATDREIWPNYFLTGNLAETYCPRHYPRDLPLFTGAVDATIASVRVDAAPARGEPPVEISLRVHTSYAGAAGDSVTLSAQLFEVPEDPQQAVGTRVLAAFGADRAVQMCGFTRVYDPKTAATWAATDWAR